MAVIKNVIKNNIVLKRSERVRQRNANGKVFHRCLVCLKCVEESPSKGLFSQKN